jgi:hypothetical protein
MKTFRVGWKFKPESDEQLRDQLSEYLGLYIEDDDLLEISLVHEIDYEFDDDDILIDITNFGISVAGVFIPYSNIACINLIAVEQG